VVLPKIGSPREEEEEEEEEEDSSMVPQVKVAEDGTLIIDEERSVELYAGIHFLSRVETRCASLSSRAPA